MPTKDEYLQLANRAIEQVHHEDRMLGDRIRNFLMATTFLVAAYGFVRSLEGAVHLYLRWAVPLFGLLLAIFFLRVLVRTCQAIRLWYVTCLWAEKSAEEAGALPLEIPYRKMRQVRYEKDFWTELFWKIFIDPNAVQGLWTPGAAGIFWILLLLVPLLGHTDCSSCLLLAGLIVLLLLWMMWLELLRRNLKKTLEPQSMAQHFAAVQGVAGPK